MNNAGLKDIRLKTLIPRAILRGVINGDSEVSGSMGSFLYLSGSIDGSSVISGSMSKQISLSGSIFGSSDVSGDIDRSSSIGKDIIEFNSIIVNNIVALSEIEILNRWNSSINTSLTFKSEIDDI